MLEAGGEPKGFWIPIPAGFSKLLVDKRYNWRFKTQAEENTQGREIAVPRGKGLGGSTLINGMIYVRGQPGDYDAWEVAGANGSISARIVRDGEHYRVTGNKYYSTGSLYADWVSAVSA